MRFDFRLTRGIRLFSWLAVFALSQFSCSSVTGPGNVTLINFNFQNDTLGWSALFADYPAGREDDIGFVAEHRTLPAPLSPAKAFYQRGDNISDDLFMCFYKQVSGLKANYAYKAAFQVEFASNYGQDCEIGVGASVYIKAGASSIMPEVSTDSSGMVVLNIDKGQQQNDGASALILDDVRNGRPGCDASVPYDIETSDRKTGTVTVRTDSVGQIWLFIGTESAFESPHEIYFTRLNVSLTEIN